VRDARARHAPTARPGCVPKSGRRGEDRAPAASRARADAPCSNESTAGFALRSRRHRERNEARQRPRRDRAAARSGDVQDRGDRSGLQDGEARDRDQRRRYEDGGSAAGPPMTEEPKGAKQEEAPRRRSALSLRRATGRLALSTALGTTAFLIVRPE